MFRRPVGGLAAALALAVTLLFVHGPALADRDVSPNHLVGAYYYLWYPENFDQGFLRAKLIPPQKPALGKYFSLYPKKVARHIDWAADHGIDFFAVSYWPDRPRLNSRIKDSLLYPPQIRRIKWCVFYETYQLGFDASMGATVFTPEVADRFVEDMKTLAREYFRHPSYLRVDGKPVVILYLTRTFLGDYPAALARTRAAWRKMGFEGYIIGDEVFWNSVSDESVGVVRDARAAKGIFRAAWKPQQRRMALFDAVTSYNMYAEDRTSQAGYGSESTYFRDLAARYGEFTAACRETGTAFVPNILPGYNDRGHRLGLDHYAIPRRLSPGAPVGSFLTESWHRLAQPFLDPKLRMVLITSFNEWNEDTQLEPTAPGRATARDSSPTGSDYSQGYTWEAYSTRCLEALKAVVDRR